MLVMKAEGTDVAAGDGAAALLLDASPAADILFASLGPPILQYNNQINDLQDVGPATVVNSSNWVRTTGINF